MTEIVDELQELDEAPAAEFEAAVEYGPAAAGLAGLDTDERYKLLESDPQYDRHGNIRNPDQADTTELDITANEGLWLHRDLAAHMFRFGYVGRVLQGGERVLDFGSGSTMPLGNIINFGLGSYLPEKYVAVDYGKFSRAAIGKRAPRKWEGRHRDNFDCTSADQVAGLVADEGQFTFISSTEVVEHIFPAEKVVDYFVNAYSALEPGGRMFLSTPIVEQDSRGRKLRARNHVHEFTTDELQSIVEACGFTVEERWGTFANYHDIKKAIKADYPAETADALLEVYERCRSLLSDNVLACMLAPAFPFASRNQSLLLRKPVA